MNVRRATAADEAVLRELWEEFERESPVPTGFTAETWEEEWRDTKRQIETIAHYRPRAVAGTPSFMAHVAGFLCGVGGIFLFRQRERPEQYWA